MRGTRTEVPEFRDGGGRDRGRLLVLLVYLGLLALLLLAPFDFGAPRDVWQGVSEDLGRYEAEPMDLAVDLAKSLAHAVIFLPLAPLLAWKYGLSLRRLFSPGLLSAAVAFSAATELLQLSVSRGTSVSDFVMNLVGYVGGAFVLWRYRDSPRLRKMASLSVSTPCLLMVLVTLLLGLHLSLRPDVGRLLGLDSLHSWSVDYPLLVGNERTGARGWLGTIQRIVIGDRAATDGDNPGRQIVYDFQPENTVHAQNGSVLEVRSPGGPTLRVDGSGVYPGRGGGITLRQETSLGAEGSSWRHLLESIRSSHEFRLEIRLRPDSLEQWGPARIVSSSWNIRERNFTLGQRGGSLELRFRTPLSGSNGTVAKLRVHQCLATGHPVDVLVVYRQGVLAFHVDGEERRRLQANALTWFCVRFFGAPPARRVGLGLGLAWWAHGFLPLWLLLKRRGIRYPWNAVVAGITSALAFLALLAL